MPHRIAGHRVPATAVYRLEELTHARDLDPGEYAIRRGDELLHITLCERLTIHDLADIVDRISATQILRVA